MEDVVVIGGLVPSLLIDQRDLPDGVSTHVGTMDLEKIAIAKSQV